MKYVSETVTTFTLPMFPLLLMITLTVQTGPSDTTGHLDSFEIELKSTGTLSTGRVILSTTSDHPTRHSRHNRPEFVLTLKTTGTEAARPRDQRGLSDISTVSNYIDLTKQAVGDGLKVCRQKTYLPRYLFRVHSCAACYHYQRDVPGMFGFPSRKWRTRDKVWNGADGILHHITVLSDLNATVTIFANSSDPSSPVWSSFANDHARKNWVDCCHAAERCCEKMGRSSSLINGSQAVTRKTCPATWDSWQCWNETEAGATVYAPCPQYIYSVLSDTSSCSATAQKTCQPDATWYSNLGSSGQSEWTNYSNCASSVVEAQKRKTYVHVTAYGVSIIALIPALIIFFSYKQLRVDRIILHENLFSSMLANGIFVILFKSIVILNELSSDASSANTIISENGVGCRLLFILTKYSRMTNYMWMFSEGYYLHKLIASAFAEQKSLLVFYLIGWVFPIIPTVIYTILRLGYANESCWVVPEETFEWILNGPSLLSLLVNMLFLINIIRVLVTKLRAAHANEPSQYRKAVRATLVLLPLFGLHFVVTIYRPSDSASSGTCQWIEIYFYTNDILDGVQGFLVALIFCYLNGEVTSLLRRSYNRWAEEHAGLRCGGRASSRLQSRSSRGSMLGRSVVSTQCYSSVPASPAEVCCNINRLSFSSNQGSGAEKQRISPLVDKKSIHNSNLNVNGTRLTPPDKSTLVESSHPKTKLRSSDAQALLSSSPDTNRPQIDTFEMKSRQKPIGSSGIGEHEF